MLLLPASTSHPHTRLWLIGISVVVLLTGFIWILLRPRAEPFSTSGAATSLSLLESPAFGSGQAIPAKYSCNGENISPPLTMSSLPPAARYVAIVVEDLDTPQRFLHWLVWDIPSQPLDIPEKFTGGVQGLNAKGTSGYTGPCPPSGRHRYRFTLFGYNQPLNLAAGSSAKQVGQALDSAVTRAELIGTYSR